MSTPTAGEFPRFSVLDVLLTACRREQAEDSIVAAARNPSSRAYACVFAVDSVLKCRDDPNLARIANEADWTLCDGMPLVLIGRRVARRDVSRCYGPDIMLGVLDKGRAAGLRHFFYGGTNEETVRLLRENLERRFPGLTVAGSIVPPFRPLTEKEKAETAAAIDAARPDVVWVGLGTPKQDYWTHEMRPLLKVPVIVNVGAAFNFHAGTVRQAPPWMRRNCLEWLYRLCVEPRRLWRRYLVGNPRFVALVLRQVLSGRPRRLGAEA